MATKIRIKPKTKPAVETRPVPGLAGKGLIRFGGESRLELRDRLQMPRAVFGRIVNVSERTIAKVESSAVQVEKLQRPYNEMYRLSEALGEVVDPESLGAWFNTPNESLGNLKPVEIVERGETDRLWNMIFRIRSGMPG